MLPGIYRATQKLYIFLIVYLTGRTPEGESYFVILVYHKIKSITKDTFWKLKSVEDKILLYKEYKLDIFNIL